MVVEGGKEMVHRMVLGKRKGKVEKTFSLHSQHHAVNLSAQQTSTHREHRLIARGTCVVQRDCHSARLPAKNTRFCHTDTGMTDSFFHPEIHSPKRMNAKVTTISRIFSFASSSVSRGGRRFSSFPSLPVPSIIFLFPLRKLG